MSNLPSLLRASTNPNTTKITKRKDMVRFETVMVKVPIAKLASPPIDEHGDVGLIM